MNHLSDLQLDRLLVGELPAVAAQAAGQHARSCTVCARRLRELTVDRDAFVRTARIARIAPGPRRWPLALAAALALLVVRSVVTPDAPRERTKGSGEPVLLLATGAPGAMVALASGDRLRTGEYLQAGYTARVDGYGAVLSRDGAGSALAYVADAGAMVALPAGTARPFPHSTLLDDVTGAERIAVVWCPAPAPLAPLLAALRTGAPLPVPAGCTVRELTLAKELAR